MKENKKADFIYGGTFEFDPSFNPLGQVEYEKAKYKKGILPKIKELEENIERGKKEGASDEELKEFILRVKKNHRDIKFEYENGEIYPKEIPFPDIRAIQYPEPHVLLTELYDNPEDWHLIKEIIQSFAEESYLSYEMGFWFASISSAINCCEYILKYELFRNLNKNNKQKLEQAKKEKLTLGNLKNNYLGCLDILGIKQIFFQDINYLNLVRNSIYHANFKKAKEVNKKGSLEIEKMAPITDSHIQPIISFKVYMIMIKLIDFYYNEKKALEYAREGIEDWMRKRNLTEEDLK